MTDGFRNDSDRFWRGWQYSSKAKIPGISGTVDRNVFYKDYSEEIEKKEETTVNKLQEHTKLEIITPTMAAQNLSGEKKSNAYLDDFTKNAGDKNYTKFARDVNNWNQRDARGSRGVRSTSSGNWSKCLD